MHLGLASGCALLPGNPEEKLIKKVAEDQLRAQIHQKAEGAYQAGKYKEAREGFEELIDLFPEVTMAYYRLGNIFFMQRELSKSAEYFEQVIERSPRNSRAHYNLAMIRLLQSERHLKFYTATMDPAGDISAISKFLGEIDAFSNALGSDTEKDELDSIQNIIDKRKNI